MCFCRFVPRIFDILFVNILSLLLFRWKQSINRILISRQCDGRENFLYTVRSSASQRPLKKNSKRTPADHIFFFCSIILINWPRFYGYYTHWYELVHQSHTGGFLHGKRLWRGTAASAHRECVCVCVFNYTANRCYYRARRLRRRGLFFPFCYIHQAQTGSSIILINKPCAK